MGWTAVESAHNLLLQPVGLRGVLSFDHSLGQLAQFLRGESTDPSNLPGELNDLGLFSLRQPFDFFDDFHRCHILRLPVMAPTCKYSHSPKSNCLAFAERNYPHCSPSTSRGKHDKAYCAGRFHHGDIPLCPARFKGTARSVHTVTAADSGDGG